ncbi:uncharacterized protein BX663DRAFT_547742 [Cokeromyces recurvatus]|uniref:uncharacterized protein n=1 Tax=Cokeromyces recurvatus TaxID=90255 RepID=UPI0022209CD9|nr:uncharacterized protein BX663DRAFT_547742 [Cokeromyces recurvatus]KAI7908123.1 hypothetical protein BX663DRAFT_547742 [Cokeromyces recurvatus]
MSITTTTAQLGQTCIFYNNNSTHTPPPQSGSSVVIDLTNSESNCQSGLYCDQAHFCVRQLKHGEVCEFDHQCSNHLSCYKNTCTTASTTTMNSHNTIHIVVSIISVILFIIVAISLHYLYFKRHRRNQRHQKNDDPLKDQHTLDTNKMKNHVLSTQQPNTMTHSIIEHQQHISTVNHILQTNYEFHPTIISSTHPSSSHVLPPPYSP